MKRLRRFRRPSRSRRSGSGTLRRWRQSASARLIEAGRRALCSLEDQACERAIRDLAQGSPPDPAAIDAERPWWLGVLSTDPAFLSDAEAASSCEMIMGLAPAGAPPPDWASVLARARALYARRAAAARSRSELHFYPSFDAAKPSPGFDILCQGRCIRAMPAFSMQSFFDDDAGRAFDPRRARRRARRAPPPDWEARFGSLHLDLWLSGYSPPLLRPLFDDWVQTLTALRDSMLEHGAARAELCPGFYSKHRETLRSDQAMEQVDQGKLDTLRSRWALMDTAGPAAASRRGATL